MQVSKVLLRELGGSCVQLDPAACDLSLLERGLGQRRGCVSLGVRS